MLKLLNTAILFFFITAACLYAQVDPDTAARVPVDRFSMDAGTLFIRNDMNGFPGPNQPIDFDKEPFITRGLSKNGEPIAYYNFDVMPSKPAPIYVLTREGENQPVAGQFNIIDDIPGDDDYNDFWQVHSVTVPSDYVANTVTSYDQIVSAGYKITPMDVIVNCPVVPEGSTAKWRLYGEDPTLTKGWYKNMRVFYFNFFEKILMPVSGMVPVSPIYVTFKINPGMEGGGPASGFVTEELTGRVHNVPSTLPQDDDYSPLWSVNVYDNADFEKVMDLNTAQMANILATGVALVNCPIAAFFTEVDRFSQEAAHLFLRTEMNGFPAPNRPVDFDVDPFITKGLGPDGEHISYYNFDVMPTEPAPIYVLMREGETSPVAGQMNIINVLPGETGYSDFWEIQHVIVPKDYVANTVTSYQQILDSGYTVMETETIVNCPVVPEGSTAKLRLYGESPELTLGWYKTKVVYYFNFFEKILMSTDSDMVPVSPIFVTFNINPGMEGGGPPSGFVTDSTGRTHNVASTLPDDAAYSPLWSVTAYDNMDYAGVFNLETALMADTIATNIATVNCPVVMIETTTSVEEGSSENPVKYSLEQNYPNPFNPSTVIKFNVLKEGNVSLKIYNSLGEEVAQLINKAMPAGSYSVEWNAGSAASGIYFYSLNTGSFSQTKKMILMR